MREPSPQELRDRILGMLAAVRGEHRSLDALVELSIELAALLLMAARRASTREERRARRTLAAMMADPSSKAFTTALADRVHRSEHPKRAADTLRHLLAMHGVPRFVSRLGRLQLRAFERLGQVPGRLVRLGIEREVRRQTRGLIFDAHPDALSKHLATRAGEGISVNVNLLGEEVLGEEAARARVEAYRALARHPSVAALSVKISGIDSQIDSFGFEHALSRLRPRLASILEAARAPTASGKKRVVHLDMEAHSDLELTVELFLATLAALDLRDVEAGIALQAYLPESIDLQTRILEYARERVARGGAPLRIRVVKGANLSMERVGASVRGLEVPVRATKAEVDAAYKRMIDVGTRPENAQVVRLGIASHNLFDLALAMLVSSTRDVESCVELEMLEGMASDTARALLAAQQSLLLYAPVVDEQDFHAAVAYLVRRLDESTEPENFLPKSFAMEAGDEAFTGERAKFVASVRARETVRRASHRTQDRRRAPVGLELDADFENEPDTDFSLAHNRRWVSDALASMLRTAPTTVSGSLEPARRERRLVPGFDPSRPGVTPYEVVLADAQDIRFIVGRASEAAAAWAVRQGREREELLHGAAQSLRERRRELIAAMVLDAGKRVVEADTEVSEAIDFAEYYLRSYREITNDSTLRLAPRTAGGVLGVALITPPWNFPLAIPAGGVFAALVAGNAVILKPALETPLVAQRLVEACHAAGVPEGVLGLAVCEDETASHLVRDPRVGTIVLTGSTETARLFLQMRPDAAIRAETGGKNATLVTAMADREMAIKNLVRSAFSHAGQKCSATSLLVLEAEVYDDPAFRGRLADATRSLIVGSAWEADSFVTPLIRKPEGALLRAMTTLDDGESWLVEPRIDPRNPLLVHPGVKLGVKPGSFMHRTELFGPVLGVMRANHLAHAVELANGTGYGLCAAVQSLDEREQRYFAEHVVAGNVYVNRGTTGAVVRRQPFGGWRASGFGPGAKAGGPGYVLELLEARDGVPATATCAPSVPCTALLEAIRGTIDAAMARTLRDAAGVYEESFERWFGATHDESHVLGQENVFRYVPHEGVVIVSFPGGEERDLVLALLAALTCAGKARLLVFEGASSAIVSRIAGAEHARVEVDFIDAAQLAALFASGTPTRFRAVGVVPASIIEVAARAGANLETAPVLRAARAELPRYLLEQSISIEGHRFGALLPSLRLAGAAGHRQSP